MTRLLCWRGGPFTAAPRHPGFGFGRGGAPPGSWPTKPGSLLAAAHPCLALNRAAGRHW